MSDQLLKPEVCVCNEEVASAIADFGKKSIAAKHALQVVVAFFECLFRDRAHMVKHKEEIKFHTIDGLDEVKKDVLHKTNSFLNSKGQTDIQKELMGERSKIVKELNKIYLEMLNATFPVDDDVAIPSKKVPSTPCTPKVPSTPSTPLDPLVSATKSIKSTTPDTPYSTMNMEGLSSAIDEILPQKTRPKYKQVETDLFETPEEITLALGEYLDTIAQAKLTVLEPSAGHGAIVKVLEAKGIKVIAQDKYTMPVSTDFLTTPIPPEAQVIVANPPFNLKWPFLAKFLESGLPFFVLLPLDTITAKRFTKLIGNTPFDVIILNGRSHFIHAGRLRDVGACAWYAFFPEATGKMTLVRIGAHDDVDLGDEDSVDGRDYDSDEHSQEVRDQAILDDPSTEFTAEGYVKDDFVMDDLLENGETEEPKEVIIRVRKSGR